MFETWCAACEKLEAFYADGYTANGERRPLRGQRPLRPVATVTPSTGLLHQAAPARAALERPPLRGDASDCLFDEPVDDPHDREDAADDGAHARQKVQEGAGALLGADADGRELVVEEDPGQGASACKSGRAGEQ
jgi:hypothetical protein